MALGVSWAPFLELWGYILGAKSLILAPWEALGTLKKTIPKKSSKRRQGSAAEAGLREDLIITELRQRPLTTHFTRPTAPQGGAAADLKAAASAADPVDDKVERMFVSE